MSMLRDIWFDIRALYVALVLFISDRFTRTAKAMVKHATRRVEVLRAEAEARLLP